MRNKGFLRKATNSFVGRALRRLMGEEKGLVMMEYIVIGLLIVTAAVVIVGAFGGAINNMFAVMGNAVIGHPTEARSQLDDGRKNFSDDVTKANDHYNKVNNSDDWADGTNKASSGTN